MDVAGTSGPGEASGPGHVLPPALVGSPLPTAILDAAGAWADPNPAMEALLGDPPATFAALVDEPGLDVAAALATEAAMTLRTRLPDGRRADAVLTSEAGDGRLVQLVDRSETERLEQRLGEAATAISRFVSRVSHDLKNPIGTAQGYAHLLLEDASVPEEARGFVARIVSSTERATETLVAIVTDARSTSRVVPPDEIDLGEVLEEVLADLAGLLSDRDAVVAAAGRLPTLRYDRRVLRRALEALIRNAVSHHPGAARVEVSARPTAGGWHVDVDDDGPGLPADQREEILDADMTAAGRGRGIGLPLTRTALARHGGELHLGDSDAGGLRARLVIPQRRSRDPEVPAG